MAVILVFALVALLSVLAMTNANTVHRLHDELRLLEKHQLRKYRPVKSIEKPSHSASTNQITEVKIGS